MEVLFNIFMIIVYVFLGAILLIVALWVIGFILNIIFFIMSLFVK